MLKGLKNKLAILGAIIALAVPLSIPAFAGAQAINLQNDVQTNGCSGSNFDFSGGSAGNCNNSAATPVNTLLKNVIDVFSLVVGIVAVIMIIIGGFRYIVSGGESSSVSGAKNAILFAVVGLIIVAVAQLIVHFVIDKSTSLT